LNPPTGLSSETPTEGRGEGGREAGNITLATARVSKAGKLRVNRRLRSAGRLGFRLVGSKRRDRNGRLKMRVAASGYFKVRGNAAPQRKEAPALNSISSGQRSCGILQLWFLRLEISQKKKRTIASREKRLTVVLFTRL